MSGTFPESTKISKVIPLFKKGDIHDLSNYRPISLLSTFSKILERLMYNRLFTFLHKHSIIFSEQFGFRKCYSTESALLFASQLLYKFYEKKEIALGVYVDLSKAFDCLDYKILLRNVETVALK